MVKWSAVCDGDGGWCQTGIGGWQMVPPGGSAGNYLLMYANEGSSLKMLPSGECVRHRDRMLPNQAPARESVCGSGGEMVWLCRWWSFCEGWDSRLREKMVGIHSVVRSTSPCWCFQNKSYICSRFVTLFAPVLCRCSNVWHWCKHGKDWDAKYWR